MSERDRALAAVAGERGVDLLLVSDLVDVRWLTGFTGSSALAVLSVEGPAPGTLLTDFRYLEQVAEQVDASWAVAQVTRDLPGPALEEQLDVVWPHEQPARIGFDDRAVTVHGLDGLREALGERAELVAAGGLVAPLREIKDSAEAGRVRAAAQLADAALLQVLERGLAGRTEAQIALDLEIAIRGLGAQELSFPPIVACGAHGALPHAEPREVEVERGQLVTIDWGCRLDGYCSDCTRTFAAGDGLEDEARDVYELVLRAQEASLAAVTPGAGGREVDAVARAIIEEAGHGEHFGHGLGHGVGLEVHEGPRLSKRSESTLAAGMVVTVEPGVYVPGRFGVRIEDLVLVTDAGHEVLNGLPKELQEIGVSAEAQVTIAARFEGPPGAANGGYVSGLLAAHMEPGPLRVTLRRPVPVDAALHVNPAGADGAAQLADAQGEVLVVAEPAGSPVAEQPPRVTLERARAAAPDAALIEAHPFPGCFGCGPQRDPAEAVALQVGPLDDGVWATAWTPGAGLPHSVDGVLAPQVVWTALDCPSSFAAVPAGSTPHVLGRIEGQAFAPVHVGEEVVVLAWPLGHEGRKRWGATAICGAGGELRALARATWIALA